MAKVRTAILISGGGSNMEALIAASRRPDYPAEIVLVVASNHKAGGIAKAKAAGIAAISFDHKAHDREGLERAVNAELEKASIELVCLAGWMRLLSPYLIGQWHNRMINIHPSLLPAFPGLHTHQRALQAGCKAVGATVHLVTPQLDHGPIVMQSVVPVRPGDDEDTLAARVLATEHVIYPLSVRWFVEGKLAIEDGHVRQTDGASQVLM